MQSALSPVSRYLVLSIGVLFSSILHAASVDPLLPMLEDEIPGDKPDICTCRFFTQDTQKHQNLLLFWSQTDKRTAYIRDSKGLQKLYLRNEKYLPKKRDLPNRGEHITALFSNAEWRIQLVGKVTRACTPKMKCEGIDYKARLLPQRNNTSLDNIDLLGHCNAC